MTQAQRIGAWLSIGLFFGLLVVWCVWGSQAALWWVWGGWTARLAWWLCYE